MQESARWFHNLEWPAPHARLAGPVVWLRGWIVGKPGCDPVDVRVRHEGRTHLGVLGLPRVDLAAHFKAPRPWLPAEFILGVPAADGALTLTLEVRDSLGAWHPLQEVPLTVAPDGQPAPRVEGRLETHPAGTWTVRDAHHPFHGHLDEPGPAPRLAHGRAPVFGWLLDETRPIARVLATTDTLVFNHLAHSLDDPALAARVSHPGAARARLRGEVDCPATVEAPVCLRVYAVAPDETVTLCFAQRFTPAATTPEICHIIRYKPSGASGAPAALPGLPSGRPRRLLLVLRTLWPDDATLRALDLARHLIPSAQWAARVVSTEDGPLRRDFERTQVESLIVDPEPLLAARSPAALHSALESLHRQIWWRHLDAVAVFDPLCGWAIGLARREGIPVLFDCLADEPITPDPTALPEVRTLLRESWTTADAWCFGSFAAARAQGALAGTTRAEVIPQWHTPGPAPARTAEGKRTALAPLRTADWLARHHPETASRWSFRQGPATVNFREELAAADDAFNQPRLHRAADWSVAGADLCLGPLFGRGPLRPVLDALAGGIPVAAPDTPTTREFFADIRLPLVDPANPLALAHELLAFDADPARLLREAERAAELIRARHAPERRLAEWARLLGTVATARG